jgi:hypothetical protein
MDMKAPAPFLPLPLDLPPRPQEPSDRVVAPPWKNRRLWIQGNSGMGKTALFQHAISGHYRHNGSAFDAFEKYGSIVVAFSARDVSDGGEDKFEPDWVIKGIKGTLSKSGLTFDDERLLKRMLESGTIAVAIDGLHEADRAKSVEAFARAFSAAPMLVTSQLSGGQQFDTWHLPADMRDFIHDLLQLYLGKTDADTVMRRITQSGLNESISSGYDVRLVIELTQGDVANAVLPRDRIGLYAAVIDKAWPEETASVKHEQQMQTAAAAWKMVSERKPHENIRRMKLDVDLDGQLLTALAEAPDRFKKPIRLIRQVGTTAFEFVHDQIHAYLAACWFTQEGFTIQELEKMVAGSAIWSHGIPARHTLWGFVSALLDNARLIALWTLVEDREEWDDLRRELKKEAENRGLARPLSLLLATPVRNDST